MLETPGLPQRKAGLLLSQRYPPLRSLGVELIETVRNGHLDEPVGLHADMLCCHLGGPRILVDRTDAPYARRLREYGFDTLPCRSTLGRKYPQDIALNALLDGRHLIGRLPFLDGALLEQAGRLGITAVDTKQGYAKCAVCMVDRDAAVTADSGLAAVLSGLGYAVLLIENGDIRLPGYSYGFIGGCCGFIGRDVMAFSGHLRFHRNFREIEAFFRRRGKRILYLADEPPLDIGGILPLAEV
ncbi:DUF6873 family GME fold protein [Candidatus Soleaferrea massiliensis]|uniref:DUF6873 family GME fold protein n=1 Tax=Candidatus Soleaferrea massiliensis TaxID=1470354 RepID=UPI0012E0212E|nr:hypothetical protein [Candidatus Soleaferrea massiliensis]